MQSRRSLLKGLSMLSVGTLTSGCLSTESSTGTATTETTEQRTKTEQATEPKTPTGTDSSQDKPTSTEPSDLELINTTNDSITLVLDIQPDNGTTTTESWDIDSGSSVEVSDYDPLDTGAQITANVENYQATTYDWTGDEPGKILRIRVSDEEIVINTMIS